MGLLEAQLTEEFSKPLVYQETPTARVQLTLTPWEVRELVRRVDVPGILNACAKKAERMAEGILDGKILSSCENPWLVAEALKVLAVAIRES